MKRRLLSLILGALLAAGALLVIHVKLRSEIESLRAEAGFRPTVPKQSPRSPARHPASLFEAWSSARGSLFDTVAFAESLNVDEALQILANLPTAPLTDNDKERLQEYAFHRLVDLDLEEALTYANDHGPDENRLDFMDYLIRRWAFDDSDACWAWYKRQAEILSDDERAALYRTIAEVRSKQVPTAREVATNWTMLQTRPGDFSGSGFCGLHMWPIVNHARHTERWPETAQRILAMDELSVGALWPVMHQWLDTDFDAATAWVASQPAGEDRKRLLRAMSYTPNGARLEGQFSREGLCDWLHSLGWKDLWTVFADWAGLQPVEAGRWLAAHPGDSEALEAARWIYAERIIEHDGEAGMAWAASLTGRRREGRIRSALRRWYGHEPWAAVAWAKENLGWSEEEVAKHLE